MDISRAIISYFLRGALNTIAKINCDEFINAIKGKPPFLVIVNHVNFLEVPVIVAFSYPAFVTGLVKKETWDNPIMSFLFNTYKAIPINRGGAFTDSFKQAKEAMKNGFHMCIAPEGTRSKNGVLGKGKPGVIQMALETNTPILPIAHCGGEHIWKNLKRFKRTPLNFRAGRPFRIKYEGKPGRQEREEIMLELMAQMAVLLPEGLRGMYADHVGREYKYLDFI